jgi:hypothetical protein
MSYLSESNPFENSSCVVRLFLHKKALILTVNHVIYLNKIVLKTVFVSGNFPSYNSTSFYLEDIIYLNETLVCTIHLLYDSPTYDKVLMLM